MKRDLILWLAGTACAVLMLVSLSSCEKIYDNLEACPHGVSLRFVYDYNMEYANAFPKQVDCLTLYVYDEEDRYVATHVVTADSLLSDENWRMQLELPEGRYRFVAYGGLACAKSSFSLQEEPADTSHWGSLRVSMDAYRQADTVHENLHNLYWGDVEVETADLYKEGTVKMMKNTNNIRIVLQDVNTQQPVYGEDFAFSITDDNTLFGADNDLLENGKVIYTPWAQGDAIVGLNTIGTEVIGAYAELSVSRLMAKNSPVLRVKSRDTGEDVIDIPLLNYLRLYKSLLYETADMGEQEFLDRQSNWTMLFLLDSQKRWVKTYIKINDWKVVINETSL